jgi:hypothetical protein
MEQQAKGLRTDLRPSVKKLLEQVGNEEIKSLTVWREVLPYSSFVKKLKPDIPYDKLFHLSLNINEKYNLDKDGVAISFKRGASKGEKINVKVPDNITIQQLFDKTRKRMGEKDFLDYTAEKLNCQDFIDNILSAIGSNSSELKKFVMQDAKAIIQKLGGKYLSFFLNIFQKAQEAVDILQEGKGDCTTEQKGEGSPVSVCINGGHRIIKIQS